MKKLVITFISIILSVYLAGSAFANITFSLNIKQIKEPTPNLKQIRPINEKQESGDQSSIKKSESVRNVEIGEDFFSYESKNAKYIYDLKNNKIITANLTNNTFVEDSLFSVVIYKINEFRNRDMLGQALTAGGTQRNPMSPVLNEHLFSMRSQKEDSELTVSSNNELVSFSWAGKELLSYSKDGVQVSQKEKEMFVKFFRYVYKGHPKILDQLSSDNIIPNSININHYHTSITKNELKISSIQTTPLKSYSLDGYLPDEIPDKANPNFKFLYEIKTAKDIQLNEHLEQLLLRASEEFDNGNYLDTLLFYQEYILCSGLQLPPTFREQNQKMRDDENVRKLQTAISSINKEITRELLIDFKKLELKSKFQMHVIKIFEANTQTGLGNLKRAKELFFEVLESSPYITGVYMDLGDIYFRERNPGMAWLCWDVARKISPSNKMLSRVEEFESRLIEEYPEYF